MVPPDADEGFKVTDRRRHLIDEESDRPAADRPEPSGRPAADRSERRDRATEEPRARRGPIIEPGAPETPPAEARRDAADASERNLTGLFVMLASSAAMALGDAPDPMTGQVHVDLDQAAEMIDLLALLREKTEGHRTPEESQVLEELIYDLQLRYVAAMKRSGRQPGLARP